MENDERLRVKMEQATSQALPRNLETKSLLDIVIQLRQVHVLHGVVKCSF